MATRDVCVYVAVVTVTVSGAYVLKDLSCQMRNDERETVLLLSFNRHSSAGFGLLAFLRVFM